MTPATAPEATMLARRPSQAFQTASKPSLLDSLRQTGTLEWFPALGLGYLDAPPIMYDLDYWESYKALDDTPCGAQLTAMRISLVARYWHGDVVDVGIGGGRFVRDRPNTYGYDISVQAMSWLAERNQWRDPYLFPVDAITCWDSLEHMRDPGALLDQVSKYVFVSMPIFNGPHHVLLSKHFKPGEHYLYAEKRGLEWLFRQHGFECIYHDFRETEAGREDIGSFVFRRIS